MPKVVVNLLKIDENISFLESVAKLYGEAMDSAGYNLSTHSVENEVKYLKDFKNSFDLAITKKQASLFEERLSENEEEACASIKEAGGKLFVTDKFGNVFHPAPFKYSYVELSYGNFKKFDKVRFLGEAAGVITARFQMEDVEHNISPTTLKLLENLDKIRKEQTRTSTSLIDKFNEIDELCERAKSKKKPPAIDWRQFFTTHFQAPVSYKKKEKGNFPTFQYEAKFDAKELSDYLQQIQDSKKDIEKALKEKKIETSAQPSKESPAEGSKQDSDNEKPEIVKCENEKVDLLQDLDEALNDLNEDLERQIEDWKRRFDPNCILKEIKDCVLPPDLDFCDFIFKDITVPKFYQKLKLLKSAGLGDLYLQIDQKLEEVFGVTQLREIDKEIKSLQKLLDEEDQIKDRLNQSLEDYRKNVLSLTEDMRPLTERLQIVQNNLDIARQVDNEKLIPKLEKQQQKLLDRISNIQQRLKNLKTQNDSIPGNLERLNVNYDEHLRRKGELERDYKQKIEQNNFNERQAKIISEGRNLEAIFLAPGNEEQRSPESIATSIISAIDTLIPLENLCKMLFQTTFSRDINLPPQIPEDVFTSFATKIKDPYLNISADLWKLFSQLLVVLIFNILDAMLKALCDAVGNVVANTIEGKDAFESLLQNAGTVGINSLVSESSEVLGNSLNKISGGIISFSATTGSADIAAAVSQTGANLARATTEVLQEDMVSWFLETGQSSAFSQWELSLDGKSFVTKNPPIFDFTQIQQFLQTGINDLIQTGEQYSTQALMDMMSGSEGPSLEEEPPSEKSALSVEQARVEIRCLFSKATALLTPTETIELLTKKPSQNTRNIVNKLAEMCAPNMANNYPGDALINLLGEIGVLAGALEIEEQLQGIQDLNNNLPITEKVLCDRYDNTLAFRQGLMSNAIEPELAGQILDEIENKKQEEFGYIIDSINSLAEGDILERPQTAKQFYSSMISQIVDMQQNGETPQSLEDLQVKESGNTSINIKEVVQQKLDKDTKENVALQSMFELTAESLIRPYRDRFRRDGENYIDAISLEIPYEKEIEVQQELQTPQGPQKVPNMDFLNIVSMGYVPTLEITEGKVTILPDKSNERLQAEQDRSALLRSYEEDIENYQFYSQLEEAGYEEPKELAKSDLEYIKSIELTPTEVSDVSSGTIAEVAEKYISLMSEGSVLLLVSGGSPKFKDFLISLAEVQSNEIRETFVTSGVIASNIKLKMLPSFILPFSKKVGSKTVLTNKIFSEDRSDGIILNANDGTLLLSNGYVEENFINYLYKISQKNTVKDNKKEVGQKYKDAIDIFSKDLFFEINEVSFSISISSRHLGNNSNPLIDRLANSGQLDYDSVVSDRISQESLDCIVQQVGNPLDLSREILSSITRQLPPEKQLLEAIPLWKLEYNQQRALGQQNADSIFSVRTTGLSFSPTGRYDDFYHDTILEGDVSSTSGEMTSMLLEKYNKIPDKFTAFESFVSTDALERTASRLGNLGGGALFEESAFGVSTVDMYQQITDTLKSKITRIFGDSRLLNNIDDSEQKLVEMFDFTREQTSYEKENNLDPNIMDFVGLKEDFISFYNEEKEEDISDEQAKGEKGSENKATKSAKNVLLVSFARLCINEYILKNIFIFDPIGFTKEIAYFSLVVKDLANFAAQEAKRVGIVRDIQKQSIKYYDLLLQNEQDDQIEEEMRKWKASNSMASTEANPKMIKIIKQEFEKCLNKFSSILKCDENTPGTDYFIDKIITSFVEMYELRNQFGLDENTATDIYVKKYVKMPKMTETAGTILTEQQKQTIREYEEKEILPSKLTQVFRSLNLSDEALQAVFQCGSENSIFETPIIFGAKLLMETRGPQDNVKNTISVKEVGYDISQKNISENYQKIYEEVLYPGLTTDRDTQIFFKYCLGFSEITEMLMTHCFLYHNDQDARFLFEGTKMMIARMYEANKETGNHTTTVDDINSMLAEQRRNEDNTGNPLGPALEALKFYYRTPIQILKGAATIVDPNIALADLIVKGAAMAGNLTGQQIDVPYSVASLSLLPFPLFNGVSPPIPPLSSYNVALPLGPIFLGLEPLLRDLPYYKNSEQGKLPTGDGKQNPYDNPLFCELSDEENDED